MLKIKLVSVFLQWVLPFHKGERFFLLLKKLFNIRLIFDNIKELHGINSENITGGFLQEQINLLT